MKRLIRKQNAKQVGMLYHFTNVVSLMNMLDTDSLEDRNNAGFISLTRNKNFNGMDRAVGSNASPMNSGLEINGDNLSEKYSIEPYNYFKVRRDGSEKNMKYDEDEERVKMKQISPIKSYITSIMLYPQVEFERALGKINAKYKVDLRSAADLKQYIESNYNIPVTVVGQDIYIDDELADCLQVL